MAGRVRSEERFAEEVLRRVLGIAVTQRDDGSAPRMADALFDLPDGRQGALEVTTIGEQAALQREGMAVRTEWEVTGARWAWLVHYGAVSMTELEEHLPTLILSSERHDVCDPRLVPYEHRREPAFAWFEASEVSMHGFPETRRPGAVDVLPEGGGGAVFEHLDELPAWLDEQLREPHLARKIRKLRSTGREELHLFLRVHDTGMPFSLYYPLATGSSVPNVGLDAPDGLSGLWLAPEWKNPLLWWGASTGWRREDCID